MRNNPRELSNIQFCCIIVSHHIVSHHKSSINLLRSRDELLPTFANVAAVSLSLGGGSRFSSWKVSRASSQSSPSLVGSFAVDLAKNLSLTPFRPRFSFSSSSSMSL